jgi:protein-S-isoprenylcysteine O-methyltransferase Ste14
MEKSQVNRIKKRVFLVFILVIIGMWLALFLPAGSLNYWHAWVFMGLLFISLIFVLSYFLKKDPEFLNKRLRFREKIAKENVMIRIGHVFFIIGFLIPGFDYRYGWSNVPFWLVIAADIGFLLSYVLIFFVFKENRYASRIVQVEKKQKVITTGPYAVVRHPMYAATIVLYLCLPVALGSYYALIFFAPILLVIFFRIYDEEKLLSRKLKGYREYMQKVKYRLIPGIW